MRPKKRRVDQVRGGLDQRAHKAQKNGAPRSDPRGPATTRLAAVRWWPSKGRVNDSAKPSSRGA